MHSAWIGVGTSYPQERKARPTGSETRMSPKGTLRGRDSEVAVGEGLVRRRLEFLLRRSPSMSWGGVAVAMLVDVVMIPFLSELCMSTWMD